MLARTMHMKPLPLAAAATLLVSVLSGCNSGHSSPATDGPLGSGGDPTHAEVCAVARVGQALTFGLEQFTNHSRALVVLDRVTLLHPHHERLVGSYAVAGYVPIGLADSWPPKYADKLPAWKHRQPVHGFRLAPGKTFTMVLGVAGTRSGTATSKGMLLYYHNTSTSYVTKDELAMTVAAGKGKC
jgi:hypothetical protein